MTAWIRALALCGAVATCASALPATAGAKHGKHAKHTKAKKKAAAAPAPASDELTPLVAAPPPAPAPAPAPAVETAPPAPVTRTITAYPDPPERAPAVEAPAPVAPASRAEKKWSLGVQVGAMAPLSVLSAGVAASLGVETTPLDGVPLRAALSVGFERHLAQGARLFLGAPQPRGFDAAATETQTLVPVELGVSWEAWRGGDGALTLGAAYALVPGFTHTAALGAVRDEQGLGQAVSLELGYGHRLGALELRVRARWGLRATSVGPVSNVLELPWYQVVGGTLGLAYLF